MRLKQLLPLIVIAGVVLALLAWRAAPRALEALPGEVRYRVPEAITDALTTPLPTALPPPATSVPGLEATVAAVAALPAAAPPPVAASTTAAAITVATATASPTPAMPALPPVVRIDGLPVIPQKFNNCGPANLATVLQGYGLDVSQFDVAAAVRPDPDDRNVSPEELRDYVAAHTLLRAELFWAGDVQTLKRLLAAGVPVIIEEGFTPHPEDGWMGHYLTVYGYDDLTGTFLTRDTYLGPWEGDGRMPYDRLADNWEAFNHVFLAIYPAEKAEAVREAVGPELAEAARMWAKAAARTRATLAGDPANAFAWFNLGASLLRLAEIGDGTATYSDAAAAFDQARLLGLPPRMLWYQFEPYQAYLAAGRPEEARALAESTIQNGGGSRVEESYLYLGHALRAQGELEGAAAAYRRAIELNEAGRAAAEARAALGEP